MRREFISKTSYSFSKEDKEKALSTIHRMIELANLTRIYGIAALAEEMSQEPNRFLTIAVNLLLDGTEPAVIRQILQNLIWAGQYRGDDLLNRLLVSEGIIAIQEGDSPSMLAMKLSSMLGENYFITEARVDHQANDNADN